MATLYAKMYDNIVCKTFLQICLDSPLATRWQPDRTQPVLIDGAEQQQFVLYPIHSTVHLQEANNNRFGVVLTASLTKVHCGA